MADEEAEIRRMAEIADAINAILEAEPGAEPDGGSSEPASTDLAAPIDANAAEMMPETAGSTAEAVLDQVTQGTGAEAGAGDFAAAPADMTPAVSDTVEGDVRISADDLDAAIAAEFKDLAADAGGDDHFGPPPVMDFSADPPPVNNAIDQEVRSGSQMDNLSIRMQDTLAELRNQTGGAFQGSDEVLADMEAARAALIGDMRGQIEQIVGETQKRRAEIMQELEQLENQSLMVRDELEMLLVKFEHNLTDLHQRYFSSADTNRERLDRYREFLQYLLDERGL